MTSAKTGVALTCPWGDHVVYVPITVTVTREFLPTGPRLTATAVPDDSNLTNHINAHTKDGYR